MGSKPWIFRKQVFANLLKKNSLKNFFDTISGQMIGGGKRDRTDDLLHAMQALSQLSYTPVPSCNAGFPAIVEP